MKAKNPIFLESVNTTDEKGQVNITQLETVVNDYSKFIEGHVFASQESVFPITNKNVKNLKEGFAVIEGWIKDYYSEEKKTTN